MCGEDDLMLSTYQFLAGFAQTWGLVYFVGVFLAVLAYALAPSRKGRFDEAARMPLQED
jgi:cytochrome c oxidase cbb3-type subunit IV